MSIAVRIFFIVTLLVPIEMLFLGIS